MDFGKIKLLIQTLKYLRFKQIYYRVYYFFRNKFFPAKVKREYQGNESQVVWKNFEVKHKNSSIDNIFTFLNLSHSFEDKIDWNYSKNGKLWTYNLNYFDFLNQEEISVEKGFFLIENYIENDDSLIDGKEPYPISLRGINWVKFLSKNQIKNSKVDEVLYAHYQLLLSNLEYHLLGNHLLENGFGLLFGAYYFQDEKLYKTAKKILKAELEEQILNDGAHFELSPMYHQILLHRVLDCISLIQQNSWKNQEMLSFLTQKGLVMLSWLEQITYKSGNIPMVNDCAYDIAPSSKKLFKYAQELRVNWNKNSELSDSGYRKVKKDNYELFIDVGNVRPSYQPGHAHSDTFNFELYYNNKPLIVDVGTSTYEKNELRQLERSTQSHNTVQIEKYEQTEVWGGFRVARRAKIIDIVEKDNSIKAKHDGYKKLGLLHQREFVCDSQKITIKDEVIGSTSRKKYAYFHFHPSIKNVIVNKDFIEVNSNIKITFEGNLDIKLSEYNYAVGFNKTEQAIKINVLFDKSLQTQIDL